MNVRYLMYFTLFHIYRGYVTLIPENGTVAWYGDILRKPTLPIMSIYGDVIGTDGHNLVMYDADGKLQPVINLGDNLFPTYR